MKRELKRGRCGFALAETAAAMALLLPVIIGSVYVTLEASQAFLIKEALLQASRTAARNLAIAYGQDPTIATSRGAMDAQVFDKIRITNMVHSSQQFSDPEFQIDSDPPTVKVTVTYASNQYGLPRFPGVDPLNLGQAYLITAFSTYRLE